MTAYKRPTTLGQKLINYKNLGLNSIRKNKQKVRQAFKTLYTLWLSYMPKSGEHASQRGLPNNDNSQLRIMLGRHATRMGKTTL